MQRVKMYLFPSWARLHRIRKCVSSGPMSDFVPQLWTSPFDAWHAAGRQDSNNGLCRDGRWQRRKHHHLRSPTRGTGRHCCEIRSEPLPPDEVHPRAVARTQPRAHGGCALGAEHTAAAPPPRRQGRTPTARPSCRSCRWSDPPHPSARPWPWLAPAERQSVNPGPGRSLHQARARGFTAIFLTTSLRGGDAGRNGKKLEAGPRSPLLPGRTCRIAGTRRPSRCPST